MSWTKTNFFYLYLGVALLTGGFALLFVGLFYHDVFSAFISLFVLTVGLLSVLFFFAKEYVTILKSNGAEKNNHQFTLKR
jgi:VIT1/CCC1 family predicted Fe2+/Mn2+ transporter